MKDKLHILMIVILATLIAMILALSGKLIEIKNRPTQAEQLDIARSNLTYSFEYDLKIETDTSDYDYSKFNRMRTNTKVEKVQEKSPELKQEVSSKIIKIASEYLEVPYVWGGTNPKTGLDCSGFTQLVYSRMGYRIPRVSKDQSRVGEIVVATNLQVGDLLFFDTMSKNGANITVKNIDLKDYFESDDYRPKDVSHVGIYIGNGKMIHAASGDGKVVISDLSENYYRKRFLHARRIL